ncbi:MAG: HD domain-containing protein [Phycisphaerales bacterium]|nr:HD domain-containing protein [Phycisphaerales bacterium]
MSSAAANRRNIKTLQPGDRVDDEVYRVAVKELRTTTTGGLYIHAILADGTGEILSRMWSASQALFDSMPEGGLLHFRGRVESYRGMRQFIIDGMRAVEPGTVRPIDFLPHTTFDVTTMWERVKEILRKVVDPNLLALLAKFIRDDDFASRFQQAPAARHNHHAFVGGLLEHTLNLLELALLIVPRYEQVSLDLVLTGIFLHDAGKIAEMNYETNFDYTTEGLLVGHIVLAVIWVHEKAREIERDTGRPFPSDLLNVLKHMILAHHGKYEFGSPKLPAVPEAVIVHHLDNLDAKVNMMLHDIAVDPDSASDWTAYNKAIESRVFKPRLAIGPENS